MTEKIEENTHQSMENTSIIIDIFESREIDLTPAEKPKRRRQVDEYDYNDPFFEQVEGELDAVEIECKLENFFVYKGEMTDNPKKIAKKFNRELKKKELQQSILTENKKSDKEENLVFSFEKVFGKGGANVKYKKEPSFLNRLFWLFYVYSKHLKENTHGSIRKTSATVEKHSNSEVSMKEHPCRDKEDQSLMCYFLSMLGNSSADYYAISLVLSKHESGRFPVLDLSLSDDEKQSFLEIKRDEIETLYKRIVERVGEESRYDSNGKSYKDFKDDKATMLFIKFYLIYIEYYTVANSRAVNFSANLASEYLSAAFPAICTNNTKLKYYARRVMDMMMAEEDYNVEDVIEGYITEEGKPLANKNDGTEADNTAQNAANIEGNDRNFISTASSITSLDLLTNSKSMNDEIFKSGPEK
ncbi:hypothetical protein PAEPH01_0607 [Pancytospora epiphaga]|nr:hypothetical protein PAEPH01_0607 [Pancytospora epiphaga]